MEAEHVIALRDLESFPGGRYRDPTCDICRVKAEPADPLTSENSRKRPLTRPFRILTLSQYFAASRPARAPIAPRRSSTCQSAWGVRLRCVLRVRSNANPSVDAYFWLGCQIRFGPELGHEAQWFAVVFASAVKCR